MACIESCLCFDLFTASIAVGLVTMAIYLVAFAVELWWIIDSNASLPIPAYTLSVGYFVIFFMSVIMIAGMIGQKSRCILAWLFSLMVFFLPEGGLVLYMSIMHWTLNHKYGLTELIFWVCRVFLDILAVIVVQSQYSTWRNEKRVLRRLQSLHMQSGVISDSMLKEGQITNGHLPSSSTQLGAYENLGFTSATDVRPLNNGFLCPVITNSRIQRSISSASQIQPPSHNLFYGGSLPGNQIKPDASDWPRLQSIHSATSATFTNSDHSQFNASTFDQTIFAFPVKSDTSLERHPSDLNNYRPRSLMYLNEDDYLTRPPPSRAVSLGYVNPNSAYSTQSLDRGKFLRLAGHRRTTSLDALDMRMRPDVHLQKVAMQPFDYLNRPGSKQGDMDNVSDNVPNLSDVAL